MSNRRNEEEEQGELGQERSSLDASADPFYPTRVQRDKQIQAYNRWKELYRQLYPKELHDYFLDVCFNQGVPYHLLAPTAVSEELRPRMTASYLYTVFQSLLNSRQFNIPLYDSVRGLSTPDAAGNLLRITNPAFCHDDLLFQAKIETKLVSHFRGTRVDKFVHLHVPTDGILYRSGVTGTLVDRHHTQGWITLPSNHDMVSPQFAAFAAHWFGTHIGGTLNSAFYFHPHCNRFDLQFWVLPSAESSNRIYLKIGFEPGFPIDPLFED